MSERRGPDSWLVLTCREFKPNDRKQRVRRSGGSGERWDSLGCAARRNQLALSVGQGTERVVLFNYIHAHLLTPLVEQAPRTPVPATLKHALPSGASRALDEGRLPHLAAKLNANKAAALNGKAVIRVLQGETSAMDYTNHHRCWVHPHPYICPWNLASTAVEMESCAHRRA